MVYPFKCAYCKYSLAGSYICIHRCSNNSIGKAALARDGLFWYVVRLLDVEGRFWTVKWLRFNRFAEGSKRIHGDVTMVHENDIVDELWQDRKGRRSI